MKTILNKAVYSLFSALLITIVSCNSSQPSEKLTNLTIGIPIEEQVTRLKKENHIFEGPDKDYIIYKGIKGNITYFVYNKDGVDYLRRLTLNFENPTINSHSGYTFITAQDISNLISFHNDQYGVVDVKMNKTSDYTSGDRDWSKGNATIHLGVSTYSYFGQGIWLASMSFGFKESIEEKLKEYEQKSFVKYITNKQDFKNTSKNLPDNKKEKLNEGESIVAINNNKGDNYILDSLLKFNSNEELIDNFGIKNIKQESGMSTYDEVFMTILYPDDRKKRVIFFWKDNSYKGLKYIKIESEISDKNIIVGSDWKTNDELMLKMPLDKLVEKNGKKVSFNQFEMDQDEAGLIINFNNGVLQKRKMNINVAANTTETNYNKLLAYEILISDMPVVKNANCYVSAITIWK